MWDSVNRALTQAAERVIMSVAGFLPGILALILALVVSIIIAWIVAAIVRRFLRGIDFDSRLGRWGFSALAEWSPSKSPTLLVSKVCAWAIIFFGLLVGMTALAADLTSRFVYRLFEYMPNLLSALFVLAIGLLAARFLSRGVLIGAVNMNIQSARLLSLGVKWLILVLAAAMALEDLRIGGDIVKLAFAILFGGIVLALALAVGLGSKEAVSRTWEKSREQTSDNEETLHHL
jgi:hypothetical protein